jgi:hypothetical protein
MATSLILSLGDNYFFSSATSTGRPSAQGPIERLHNPDAPDVCIPPMALSVQLRAEMGLPPLLLMTR